MGMDIVVCGEGFGDIFLRNLGAYAGLSGVSTLSCQRVGHFDVLLYYLYLLLQVIYPYAHPIHSFIY